VIRGPDDRGRVFLVDDRFRRAEVRRLLPGWWRVGIELLQSGDPPPDPMQDLIAPPGATTR
jgi:DNA excision repair protein ERCC-2